MRWKYVHLVCGGVDVYKTGLEMVTMRETVMSTAVACLIAVGALVPVSNALGAPESGNRAGGHGGLPRPTQTSVVDRAVTDSGGQHSVRFHPLRIIEAKPVVPKSTKVLGQAAGALSGDKRSPTNSRSEPLLPPGCRHLEVCVHGACGIVGKMGGSSEDVDVAGYAYPPHPTHRVALVRSMAPGSLDERVVSTWDRPPCSSTVTRARS